MCAVRMSAWDPASAGGKCAATQRIPCRVEPAGAAWVGERTTAAEQVAEDGDGIGEIESPIVRRIAGLEARAWIPPREQVGQDRDRVGEVYEPIVVEIAASEGFALASVGNPVAIAVGFSCVGTVLEDGQGRASVSAKHQDQVVIAV